MLKQYFNYKNISQTDIELLYIEATDQRYPVHFHKKFCLGEIVSGYLRIKYENEVRKYKKGDVFLIPPGKSHSCIIRKDETVCYKIFSFNNISELLSKISTDKSAEKLFDEKHREILIHILEDNKTEKNGYSDLINSIMFYLDKQYSDPVDIDSLSDFFKLSQSRIQHLFKEETGISISKYILLERIRKSKDLLSKQSQVNVAMDCGFYDQSQFCRYFKKYTGISPKKYANSINDFKRYISPLTPFPVLDQYS